MSNKPRKGFYHSAVNGISVTILLIGILAITSGIVTVYYVTTTVCQKAYHPYNHHGYYFGETTTIPTSVKYTATDCRYFGSKFGAGLWVGLMFVAVGTVGIIAAQRKSTCMILSLLVTSVPCFLFGLAGVGLGIYSEVDGNDYYSRDIVTKRPMALYISNGMLAFISLIATILDIILFAFTCRAICCCVKSDIDYKKLVKEETESDHQPFQHQKQQPVHFSPFSWPGFAPMQQPAQGQNTTTQGYMVMMVPNTQGGYMPLQQPAMQFVAQPAPAVTNSTIPCSSTPEGDNIAA